MKIKTIIPALIWGLISFILLYFSWTQWGLDSVSFSAGVLWYWVVSTGFNILKQLKDVM